MQCFTQVRRNVATWVRGEPGEAEGAVLCQWHEQLKQLLQEANKVGGWRVRHVYISEQLPIWLVRILTCSILWRISWVCMLLVTCYCASILHASSE
jgi:hypothetical protein